VNGDSKYRAATIDVERFGIGRGRDRPKLRPKNVTCPNCRASLTVKDEAAKMLGCEYCGAALEMSGEAVKAFGLQDRRFEFPLKIGQRFDWKGVKYEVAARIALMEDKDPSEITSEFLLYSPRRGSMWLSEYHGEWDLSWQTRVMPKSDPFSEGALGLLETGDGRKWIKSESGFYEVAYVDGALPWEARAGDTIMYAEFSERGGRLRYEAERAYGELEYSMGHALNGEQLKRAIGTGGDAPSISAADPLDRRAVFRKAMTIAALACAANLVIAWGVGRLGTRVLSDGFQPPQVSQGAETGEFQVASGGNLIRVDVESPGLDNEWLAYDLTLLEGDTSLLNVNGQLEYFHGVDEGESWSEGSRSDSIYVKVPKAGSYRLAVQGASARGDQQTSETSSRELRVEVTDGARIPMHFLIMAAVCGVLAVLSGIIAYAKFGGDDD
jgi:ribosomal protein S27E